MVLSQAPRGGRPAGMLGTTQSNEAAKSTTTRPRTRPAKIIGHARHVRQRNRGGGRLQQIPVQIPVEALLDGVALLRGRVHRVP